jgi:hypothetical protein
MGGPETCGAIFRVLDYLCKRDGSGAGDVVVVDKATKKFWRWFCEMNYNGGHGEVVHSARKIRAKERYAASAKGQNEMFEDMVDKVFEDTYIL